MVSKTKRIKREFVTFLKRTRAILDGSQKPIIYIDMDGVVADFDKAFPLVAQKTWIQGQERKVPAGFFENLEPIEGCVEAITKLSEFYDIYFLSTPQWSNPLCWSEKRNWIANHFSEVGFKKLILSHHKRLNAGDYLIDDIVHKGFYGEHIHFGKNRFPNWKSVTDYLLSEDKK